MMLFHMQLSALSIVDSRKSSSCLKKGLRTILAGLYNQKKMLNFDFLQQKLEDVTTFCVHKDTIERPIL